MLSNYDNYIKCKRAEAKTKYIYKQKKRSSWRQFCEKIDKSTNVSDVWKKIKILNKNTVNTRRTPSQNGDWINDLLNNLVPPTCQERLQEIISDSICNNELNNPFTLNELNYFQKTTSNTSPGYNQIHYPMLYNLSIKSKRLFLNIINDLWATERVISEWSTQYVIPVLKPKKDPSEASSYRPISLFSCLMKTYERLIKI